MGVDFRDRFARLDQAVWTDSYLPAWSSRAAAAASYTTGDGGLTLAIPPDQPLWCPDLHPTPLRVSAIHSANRSGPVGSTDAPQPFVAGQVVRQQQPTVVGFAPCYGIIAVTCSAVIGPRSMFSAWMVGLEDRPERSGEICLMEFFGETVKDGVATVGRGLHPFRDPNLVDDFVATPMRLDIGEPHTYQVDWRPGSVSFSIDGHETHASSQSPDYPMMLILGVFDFPDRPGDPTHTPSLDVTEVSGTQLGPNSLVADSA